MKPTYKDWQIRRRREQAKLAAANAAFGGAFERMKAMYHDTHGQNTLDKWRETILGESDDPSKKDSGDKESLG